MSRAVFLDKDGTLIDDVPYNVDPDRITLAPGARAGCAALHAAGWQLVVVTNQSGAARGLFDVSALVGVEARLRDLLGVPIADFRYCPHHPAGTVPELSYACDCRKPQPGMLLASGEALGIDMAASWMVGDILNDVEAGRRAGCRTILIDNGNETEWTPGPLREPHRRVADMAGAADVILAA